MLKAEICRAIAEKMQGTTSESRPWWIEVCESGDPCIGDQSKQYKSHKRKYHKRVYPNFFTDESASARLRRVIRKQFKYVAVCYQRQGETTNTDQIEFEFSESIDDKPGIYWLYKGSDELEAWALAAAEWLKIEVGELTN